jgi:hypothetical protein
MIGSPRRSKIDLMLLSLKKMRKMLILMLLHPRLLLRCHQMMYLLSTILSSARG